MRYGPIVAKRWKRQYFKRITKREKAWAEYFNWEIQPSEIYTILLELKSKAVIEALIGPSWTRYLRIRKQPPTRDERSRG